MFKNKYIKIKMYFYRFPHDYSGDFEPYSFLLSFPFFHSLMNFRGLAKNENVVVNLNNKKVPVRIIKMKFDEKTEANSFGTRNK